MVHRMEQTSTILLKPIQVSPRGFKRQIETMLGALIQLRKRVTLFAKLPKGKNWSSDLMQYSQTIDPRPDVFVWAREVNRQQDWQQSIIIPQAHPMQKEYFLLALSETVSCLLQGYREDVITDSESLHDPMAKMPPPEEPEVLPRVNYSITFQKSLIQTFVNELQGSVQTSLAEHPQQGFLHSLVANWDDRMQVPEHCHSALMDAILLQDGQHQERLQQQARAYRRQAMSVSSLSTQNESLINTLRLKDDFLNTVGQELRTPLSTIKTALPLLHSPNLKPPQRQRYLDMISRECDRQVNLINGVLELLQVERTLMTTQPEPVNLFDILPGIVSTYQPLAQEKGIRLAYTVPNTLPAICCPQNWVRQIVIQLLSNSIRFTNAGGEVWVTAQPAEDETLVINVKDTGVGIPQSELPHVFEHFYRGRQTPSEEEGAGLGLAIVRQLLLYCDGRISVESQPEVGTHIMVKLPLYQTG
ncbi:MAG: ATP-binding protein [Cyanobacteria bacterium P01_H01_bin.153]